MNKKLRFILGSGVVLLILVALAIFLRLGVLAAKASPQWSSGSVSALPANAAGPQGGSTNPSGQPLAGGPNNNGAPGSVGYVQPSGQISYQGRLLQNGNLYNGDINIRFNLYNAASGGSAWWSETQLVHVNQGLFNVMLGAVTPINPKYLDYQTWLGIKPAGASSELTPRQLLGAAPYAMSVVPGATMYDSSAAGGYNSSFWVSSDNHIPIYAISSTQDGIESHTDGAGKSAVNASANGDDGHAVSGDYSGDSTSCSGGGTDCASALYANTSGDSYGIFDHTTGRSGLYISSTSAGYWNIYDTDSTGSTHGGIYTTGPLTVLGYATFSGGKSGYVVDIARNGGSQPLERGDVVIIIGGEPAVVGDIPVALVDRTKATNSTSLMGVVDVLYTPCDKPAADLQAGEACGGFDPSVTTIQPGQYLGVVTLGAYGYLKVDASAGPIAAGDLLTTSATLGRAMKAGMLSVQGVSFYAPGTIIGKALGSLDSGTGYIPVFVSPR